MRYFFGFAGIPQDIRQEVERENKKFALGAEFCIDKMPNFAGYNQKNIDYFVGKFHEKVAADKDNLLQDTGFAIIYVVKDEASTARFLNAFFPHMLLIPVTWTLDGTGGKSQMLASKNLLIPLLQQATAQARSALRVLGDEVKSRASTTPILLPPQNFTSKELIPSLKLLHQKLAVEDNPLLAIKDHLNNFKFNHPPQRIEGKNRDCFIDDLHVQFHPPGNDRHGFARANDKHLPHCILAGKRRLGAPYDPLFHYDCQKGGKGNLKGAFYGCHDAHKSNREGKPHLNIAPNDNVRG